MIVGDEGLEVTDEGQDERGAAAAALMLPHRYPHHGISSIITPYVQVRQVPGLAIAPMLPGGEICPWFLDLAGQQEQVAFHRVQLLAPPAARMQVFIPEIVLGILIFRFAVFSYCLWSNSAISI